MAAAAMAAAPGVANPQLLQILDAPNIARAALGLPTIDANNIESIDTGLLLDVNEMLQQIRGLGTKNSTNINGAFSTYIISRVLYTFVNSPYRGNSNGLHAIPGINANSIREYLESVNIASGDEDAGYTNLLRKLYPGLRIDGKIARDFFETKTPNEQCERTDVGECKANVTVCYICLQRIIDVKKAQCEHILPIIDAIKYTGLYHENPKGYAAIVYNLFQKALLKIEYRWAHNCCNIIKNASRWLTNELKIDMVNITNVLTHIFNSINTAKEKDLCKYLNTPLYNKTAKKYLNNQVNINRIAQHYVNPTALIVNKQKDILKKEYEKLGPITTPQELEFYNLICNARTLSKIILPNFTTIIPRSASMVLQDIDKKIQSINHIILGLNQIIATNKVAGVLPTTIQIKKQEAVTNKINLADILIKFTKEYTKLNNEYNTKIKGKELIPTNLPNMYNLSERITVARNNLEADYTIITQISTKTTLALKALKIEKPEKPDRPSKALKAAAKGKGKKGGYNTSKKYKDSRQYDKPKKGGYNTSKKYKGKKGGKYTDLYIPLYEYVTSLVQYIQSIDEINQMKKGIMYAIEQPNVVQPFIPIDDYFKVEEYEEEEDTTFTSFNESDIIGVAAAYAPTYTNSEAFHFYTEKYKEAFIPTYQEIKKETTDHAAAEAAAAAAEAGAGTAAAAEAGTAAAAEAAEAAHAAAVYSAAYIANAHATKEVAQIERRAYPEIHDAHIATVEPEIKKAADSADAEKAAAVAVAVERARPAVERAATEEVTSLDDELKKYTQNFIETYGKIFSDDNSFQQEFEKANGFYSIEYIYRLQPILVEYNNILRNTFMRFFREDPNILLAKPTYTITRLYECLANFMDIQYEYFNSISQAPLPITMSTAANVPVVNSIFNRLKHPPVFKVEASSEKASNENEMKQIEPNYLNGNPRIRPNPFGTYPFSKPNPRKGPNDNNSGSGAASAAPSSHPPINRFLLYGPPPPPGAASASAASATSKAMTVPTNLANSMQRINNALTILQQQQEQQQQPQQEQQQQPQQPRQQPQQPSNWASTPPAYRFRPSQRQQQQPQQPRQPSTWASTPAAFRFIPSQVQQPMAAQVQQPMAAPKGNMDIIPAPKSVLKKQQKKIAANNLAPAYTYAPFIKRRQDYRTSLKFGQPVQNAQKVYQQKLLKRQTRRRNPPIIVNPLGLAQGGYKTKHKKQRKHKTRKQRKQRKQRN